jgi:hypothetical protein
VVELFDTLGIFAIVVTLTIVGTVAIVGTLVIVGAFAFVWLLAGFVLVDVALLSIVVALFIALVNSLVEVGALFDALFVAPTIFDALFLAPTLFDTLCTLPCTLPCIVHRCVVVGEVAMLFDAQFVVATLSSARSFPCQITVFVSAGRCASVWSHIHPWVAKPGIDRTSKLQKC